MASETSQTLVVQMARNLLDTVPNAQHSLSLEDLYDLQSTLSQTIALVKESINHRRSPIVNMPVEIFEHIFRHAIQWRDSGLQCRGFDPPTHAALMKDRIRIGLVCRRWRAVSLSIPSLWTAIDDSKREMLEEFLHRSQHMPLDVLLEDILPQGPSFSAYAPRIRDLFVKLPKRGVELTSEVPQLECLTVVARNRFPQFRTTVETDARTRIVPPSNLHALRVLVAHELQAFPDIPYSQLTRLYIDNSRLGAPHVLLNVLEHCAQLERLVLVNVDFLLHGPDHEQRTVELPRLQLCALGMTEFGVHAGPMLRCLALPPTVALRISGSGTIEELAALSPFPTLPCLAGCTDLAVDCGVSTVTLYLSGSPGTGAGSLRLQFSVTFSDGSPDGAARAVFNALIPFAALERATLRAHPFGEYVAVFTDALARAATPQLRALRVIDKTPIWPAARLAAQSVGAVLACPDGPRVLEVWTALPRVLAVVVAAGALERVVYHPTVVAAPVAEGSNSVAEVIEEVRARVPDVKVCEVEALPSIPGIDDLEKEYGFY